MKPIVSTMGVATVPLAIIAPNANCHSTGTRDRSGFEKDCEHQAEHAGSACKSPETARPTNFNSAIFHGSRRRAPRTFLQAACLRASPPGLFGQPISRRRVRRTAATGPAQAKRLQRPRRIEPISAERRLGLPPPAAYRPKSMPKIQPVGVKNSVIRHDRKAAESAS